jgi:predicted metal-dependent peptidase
VNDVFSIADIYANISNEAEDQPFEIDPSALQGVLDNIGKFEIEAYRSIVKAKASLRNKSPFYGFILENMKINPTDSTPTMGVDKSGDLWFNANFVQSLDHDKIMGVLCHEVLHNTLLTFFRENDKLPIVWNIATDYAINKLLLWTLEKDIGN